MADHTINEKHIRAMATLQLLDNLIDRDDFVRAVGITASGPLAVKQIRQVLVENERRARGT